MGFSLAALFAPAHGLPLLRSSVLAGSQRPGTSSHDCVRPDFCKSRLPYTSIPNKKTWAGSIGQGCPAWNYAAPRPLCFASVSRIPPPLSKMLMAPPHLGFPFHDIACTVAVIAATYLWFHLFDALVRRKLLDPKLSRKLLHISSGILYASLWPMYSMSPWARYFAVTVPLASVVRLLIYGLGVLKNERLVKSISREGAAVELLRGPLYYVIVLAFCTVIFWRGSPIGVIALANMCGGDGIADIVGRRMGSIKLPYNPSKSWAGSISMFIFGLTISMGFIYYYTSMGFYHVDWESALQRVGLITLIATLVESLPIASYIDDNLSVPLVSVLVGMFLFPSTSL